MCKGTTTSLRLALASKDAEDANGMIHLLPGIWEEASSFDTARVSWRLFDSTGDLNVHAIAAYSNDGLHIAAFETVGTASAAAGIHAQPLFTPNADYKYVAFGLEAGRVGGTEGDVASGAAWFTVEYH